MTARDLSWLTARPIAHRGFHDRAAGILENTLSAAEAAIARGFSIELDLQASADGVPMVFHDFTLDRLTAETGRVSERTAADLEKIAITGGPDRIITFRTYLESVAGRAGLLVELKSDFSANDTLIAPVVEALSRYDGPIAVMSFDPRLIIALRKAAPQILRGITADETACDDDDWATLAIWQRLALRHILHAPWSRPDFVSYHVTALPMAGPFVLKHVFGTALLSWTVRTEVERQASARHADQMTFEGFDPDAV